MSDRWEQLEQRIEAEAASFDALSKRLPPPPGAAAAVSRARAAVRGELARRRVSWMVRLMPAGGVAAALVMAWFAGAPLAAPLRGGDDFAASDPLDEWAAAFHDSGDQLVSQWLGGNDATVAEDPLEADLNAWGLSEDDESEGI
ncbi:MAG: hypothetical protein SF069_12405 [Phycisphaerae bacterium]|nr:hypothetical protein [Phycisphaerae bacterium]